MGILWFGLSVNATNATEHPPAIKTYYTALAPIKWVIEKIGFPYVQVTFLVPVGKNHELYTPKPSQLYGLAQAVGYFTLNLPFEQDWQQKFLQLQPQGMMIDLLEGIDVLDFQTHHDDDHPKNHLETQQIYDPHIWISPPELRIMVQHVTDHLVKQDPIHRNYFETRKRDLLEIIARYDQRLRLATQGCPSFLADHPTWRYFSRHYGIPFMSIEEGERKITPSQINKIHRMALEKQICVVLLETTHRDLPVALIPHSLKRVSIQPAAENLAHTFEELIQAFLH